MVFCAMEMNAIQSFSLLCRLFQARAELKQLFHGHREFELRQWSRSCWGVEVEGIIGPTLVVSQEGLWLIRGYSFHVRCLLKDKTIRPHAIAARGRKGQYLTWWKRRRALAKPWVLDCNSGARGRADVPLLECGAPPVGCPQTPPWLEGLCCGVEVKGIISSTHRLWVKENFSL